MSKVTLSFSYQEDVKEKLQKLADKKGRTLANYIAAIILDEAVKTLQKRGEK